MTGFGRFSVNEARKIINNFSVAPFVYSLLFYYTLCKALVNKIPPSIAEAMISQIVASNTRI